MTKQEIAEIIESKGNEYGFKMRDMGVAWTSEQTSESYIRIELFKETDYDKSNWEDRRVAINLKVTGCICRMGDRRGAEELQKIAEEIARGTKLVAELENMNLSYIEIY
ncbi:hypothetical protein [Selenomonas sp. AB3002]|uniref:hypothetical protein n=1 Tax=Selenomonas sp. AB3002 TaxID=1392502 RepID=UPI0004971A16